MAVLDVDAASAVSMVVVVSAAHVDMAVEVTASTTVEWAAMTSVATDTTMASAATAVGHDSKSQWPHCLRPQLLLW